MNQPLNSITQQMAFALFNRGHCLCKNGLNVQKSEACLHTINLFRGLGRTLVLRIRKLQILKITHPFLEISTTGYRITNEALLELSSLR
jgi:hypothetical protein